MLARGQSGMTWWDGLWRWYRRHSYLGQWRPGEGGAFLFFPELAVYRLSRSVFLLLIMLCTKGAALVMSSSMSWLTRSSESKNGACSIVGGWGDCAALSVASRQRSNDSSRGFFPGFICLCSGDWRSVVYSADIEDRDELGWDWETEVSSCFLARVSPPECVFAYVVHVASSVLLIWWSASPDSWFETSIFTTYMSLDKFAFMFSIVVFDDSIWPLTVSTMRDSKIFSRRPKSVWTLSSLVSRSLIHLSCRSTWETLSEFMASFWSFMIFWWLINLSRSRTLAASRQPSWAEFWWRCCCGCSSRVFVVGEVSALCPAIAFEATRRGSLVEILGWLRRK